MCRQLSNLLPDEFAPEPRVQLGPYFDFDISVNEAAPLAVSELEAVKQYAYEVLIFDRSRGNRTRQPR